MIEVWIKGKGFKKIDGFKQLHKGDKFRIKDCGTIGPVMIAESEHYVTIKDGKRVEGIKADFFYGGDYD